MEAKKIDYERLPELVADLPVGIFGMTAKLVVRTDSKAIYWRWDKVWEVFRIKISPEAIVYGKKYPKREVYPGNEDFGSIAWAYKSERLARERYEVL